jgi:lysozyme
MIAELIIKLEESYRSKPYLCTSNFPTIGWGRVIGKQGDPLPNILANKKEEDTFLRNTINVLQRKLQETFPTAWGKCNPARQAVLISMAYQLGLSGVSGFKKMWLALEKGNFVSAAKEMSDSRWYKQTPNRAKRHIEQMLKGDTLTYYLTNKEFQ